MGSGEIVTVIGLGTVVAFRRRDDRLRRGGRRTLGRAHHARAGQLLVRGIPHARQPASTVRGLVIAVIEATLDARAMKRTRALLDLSPSETSTRSAAVDLTAVVTATDAELHSARCARSATMIVQTRGAIAGRLALSRGTREGQPVSRPRGKGGRELSLSAFVVSGDRRRDLHGLRDQANFPVELRSRFTRIGVASDTLEEKLRKIDGYAAAGIIAPRDVVLVALNCGAIADSDLHDVELPLLARAVFPIVRRSCSFRPTESRNPVCRRRRDSTSARR